MNATPYIYFIEDEEDIRELVVFNLEKKGYRVGSAATGELGMKSLRNEPAELLLLDIMLPGLSGLEICKILKSDVKTQKIPIIMVTAKGEEDDIIKGLELGADDYITKPFQLNELLARVNALLRRSQSKRTGESTFEERMDVLPFVWFPGKAEIYVKGEKLELTLSEYRIMELMLSKPGWVFTRNQIMVHVKGEEAHSTYRAIDVVVVGLRKKLKAVGADIETVRGIGYRIQSHEV